MFCTKCGSKVADGDKFCSNCGNMMPVAAPVEEDYNEYGPEEVNYEEEEYEGYGYMSIEEVDRLFDIEKIPTPEEKGLKKVYIFDFLSRMVKKSNIPLFIYLLLNVVIIGLIVTLFCQLPIYWGILAGLILYVASISVALSPIGEAILRHQTGCRKIEDPEIIERLYPLFKEVYYKAKQAEPKISNDVRLFMNDDDCPNAFATGRKTMCVTQGLLELDDEAIKATLGHEFGHLAHKDTDRILVVRIGNTFISAIAIMFQIGALLMEWFSYIMAIFTGNDEGFLVAMFGTIARVITMFVINVFLKLWDLLGVALCMKTSRNNEYEADEFSVGLGYANGLIALLSFIGGEKPKGLFATLASSHPASSDRIARIRQIAVNK